MLRVVWIPQIERGVAIGNEDDVGRVLVLEINGISGPETSLPVGSTIVVARVTAVDDRGKGVVVGGRLLGYFGHIGKVDERHLDGVIRVAVLAVVLKQCSGKLVDGFLCRLETALIALLPPVTLAGVLLVVVPEMIRRIPIRSRIGTCQLMVLAINEAVEGAIRAVSRGVCHLGITGGGIHRGRRVEDDDDVCLAGLLLSVTSHGQGDGISAVMLVFDGLLVVRNTTSSRKRDADASHNHGKCGDQCHHPCSQLRSSTHCQPLRTITLRGPCLTYMPKARGRRTRPGVKTQSFAFSCCHWDGLRFRLVFAHDYLSHYLL